MSASAWLAELWTAEMSAGSDRHTMETMGVPSALLMERAALSVARELAAMRDDGDPRPVRVLCGPGNNGGDGVAVARQLCGWGLPAEVVLVTDKRNDTVEHQLGLARAYGVAIHSQWPDQNGPCVWVDAMLGTGSTGAPRGTVADALERVQAHAGPRLAVDIPTGVDPDTGAVRGHGFRADVTVTFARSKPGLHVTPGRALAGRVVVADIGLMPPPGQSSQVGLIEPSWVNGCLQKLPPGSHKGKRGHLGVVGGSAGTTGAAVLTGAAALRSGVGMVTLCSDDATVREQLLRHRPELMVTARGQGAPVPDAQALVVGPGLTAPEARVGLRSLWTDDTRAAIWDASALDHVPVGTAGGGPRIVTPHPGEAARMLARAEDDAEWTAGRVQSDRPAAARALARITSAVAVLKGEGTLVAEPDGRLWVCLTGDSTLATAGSGDCLAGMIGAFLARGLSAVDAAKAGVHLHGLAGEVAGRRFPGAVALDVADTIGPVLRRPPAVVRLPRLRRG